MLVLKIDKGEHVTIFDRTDGASPPITISCVSDNGATRLVIDADQRYGFLRSNAKVKHPKAAIGGKDAKPISA